MRALSQNDGVPLVVCTLMSRSEHSCKSCDFSQKNHKSDDFSHYLRIFAVLCHFNDHQSPKTLADFTKFANKSDDFSRHLRFFDSSVSHVNDHLSPKPVADFTKFTKEAKNRKSDDFLAILAITCHRNQGIPTRKSTKLFK